jgi:agmatine deiminase
MSHHEAGGDAPAPTPAPDPVPDPTPASLGYRMPAEWEPHEGTWIAWPHHRDDWPGKFAPVPWVYVEIVRHLSRVERVHILVKGRRRRERAIDQLDAHGVDLDRVEFVKAATDRVWLRDSGPTFVVDEGGGGSRRIALVDWRFNAWAK